MHYNSSWFIPRMKTGRGVIILSLLAVFALLLAACSSGGSNTTTTGPKNTTLTLSTGPKGNFTTDFDPFLSQPTDGTFGVQYETLLFYDRMNGNVTPWLASSYQLASDATNVTFTLRQNVKWSDGSAFTSDDVLFTLNAMKQYPAADLNGLWSTIQDITAPDAHTVKVTFKQPNAPVMWFLAGQTYIVQKKQWQNVGDVSKYTNPHPIGTGPYTLKSFSPSLVDLVKNPNYWQPGKPVVQELKYPAFNSNTSAELLLSRNQVDWTGLFTADVQKTYVNLDPAHNHYWFPASNVVMLYLNTAKSPFNQLPVRKAISFALDRQSMSKTAESGYEPVASPTALVLPANQKFLASQYSSAAFSQDANQANTLLTGAGFKKGSDGIYADSSGKKLSFNLDVVTGWTDWVTICQIVANNLKAIGINVNVNAIAFANYFSALQTGGFDMAISWTNPGPNPYNLYYSMLDSVNTKPVGQSAASNWERWSDPATDNALKQFASTTDSGVQQQAIATIEGVMVNQLPSIPLLDGATWNEYSTARFTGWATQDNPYALPAPFSYPDVEVTLLSLKSA